MRYYTLAHLIFGVLLVGPLAGASGEMKKKDQDERLPPFSHKFDWESFTVSRNDPVSQDGRYRLIKVERDGSVELACLAESAEPKEIIVRPMPRRLREGERPPTIIVVESNVKNQSATIKELRMK